LLCLRLESLVNQLVEARRVVDSSDRQPFPVAATLPERRFSDNDLVQAANFLQSLPKESPWAVLPDIQLGEQGHAEGRRPSLQSQALRSEQETTRQPSMESSRDKHALKRRRRAEPHWDESDSPSDNLLEAELDDSEEETGPRNAAMVTDSYGRPR
jgi:hypothetical protein